MLPSIPIQIDQSLPPCNHHEEMKSGYDDLDVLQTPCCGKKFLRQTFKWKYQQYVNYLNDSELPLPDSLCCSNHINYFRSPYYSRINPITGYHYMYKNFYEISRPFNYRMLWINRDFTPQLNI